MGWPSFDETEEHIKEDSQEGWCTYCEDWTHDSCEPDAHHYTCPVCSNKTVFSPWEIMLTDNCSDDDYDDETDDSWGDRD